MEEVNNAATGKSLGDVLTIKASKDFGLFGGLLSKLLLNLEEQAEIFYRLVRRSLPIGKVTGGRLFAF